MQIWKLDCDVNTFAAIELIVDDDYKALRAFDGRSHREAWKAPPARWGRGIRGDFAYLTAGAIGASQRGITELFRVIAGEAELLPMSVGDATISVINVINVRDALDRGHSDIKYFSSSGRVMRVIRYRFLLDRLGGESVFRVPELDTVIFATDVFRERVLEARLTGLTFEGPL